MAGNNETNIANFSNKLSKPKIWRINPQKLTPVISLIHYSLAKNWLLMNGSSLILMTYCSLAKELMGIKNSTHSLKYSILHNNHNGYNSTIPFQIFFLSNVSKLSHNQNTNSNHNLKTNQITTKNEKNK